MGVAVGARTRGVGGAGRGPLGLRALVAAVGLAFAAPLVYVASQSVGGDGVLTDVLLTDRVLGPLGRTLLLATTVSIAATVVGVGLAWLTVRTDLPLRRLWRTLAPVPLVFPSFIAAAALVEAFGPDGLATGIARPFGVDDLPRPQGYWGALWILTLFTYPYVFLPVAARLSALPPSLEESARLLGRRPLAVFRTVVLPQIGPAARAGALLVFLYALSEFGAIVVLRYDTVTRAIYANRLLDRPFALALSLVLGVLALAVVVAERRLARRLPHLASASRRPLQVPLGRWRIPALLAVLALVGAALLAPVASLAAWVVRGIDAGGRSALDLSAGDVAALAGNTGAVSVGAALLATAVVLPVAYLAHRWRSTTAAASGSLVTAGFALPGIVVAIALVAWSLSAPGGEAIYQTFPLLITAYVIHFGAQALRSAQVAVGAVPNRLDEAARVLGAGRLRRFRTIDLPLMLPGLGAGAGLVALSTMKELPITLLLSPIGFETLVTRTWSRYEEAFLPEAGVVALVLVALSALLTWALVLRRAEATA